MQSRDQESFAQLKLLHTIILYNFEKNSTNFRVNRLQRNKRNNNEISDNDHEFSSSSSSSKKKLNKINGSRKKNNEKLLFPFNSCCFHIWNKTKVGTIINWMIYQVILNDKTHYAACAQIHEKNERRNRSTETLLMLNEMKRKKKFKFHICMNRACEKEYARKSCSGEKELNVSFFPSLFVAH